MIEATAVMADVANALTDTGGDKLLSDLAKNSTTTYQHSKKVGSLAIHVGCAVPDISREIVARLAYSAMLHDVGKADPAILPLVEACRPLDPEEQERLNRIHTRSGSRMIDALRSDPLGVYGPWNTTASFGAEFHHVPTRVLIADNPEKAELVEITNLIHAIDVFEAVQGNRPYRTGPAAAYPAEAGALVMAEVEVQPFWGMEPEQIIDELVQAWR